MMSVALYLDESLSNYGFPDHPFGTYRYGVFRDEALKRGLLEKCLLKTGRFASRDELLVFHEPEYIDFVKDLSDKGYGVLDSGDTPAYSGVYEASSYVVGTTLEAVQRLQGRETEAAFIPIAGLHHAYPDRASGFCVFNDIGIATKALLQENPQMTIAYIDIDVHHGDGVYYGFENDPRIVFYDIHQHPLFPGTGWAEECGKEKAYGVKHNYTLSPGAGDEDFFSLWETIEKDLTKQRFDFIVLEAGADGLKGDPLANLNYTPSIHFRVAKRLMDIARKNKCPLLALGGGGYHPRNIAQAWCATVEGLLASTD